jgi:hypothetical protein
VSAARAAVVLAAPGAVTLGVYERLASGRLRAHARREVALDEGTWPAIRAAAAPLVELARARGAGEVVLALRASLRAGRWPAGVAAEARRLRCALLLPTAEEELRWLFLGGVRASRAEDGVVAELEPDGIALARYRGRIYAAGTRLSPADLRHDGGVLPLGAAGALVVTGSAVEALRGGAGGRVLTRAELTGRSRNPAAAQVRRLMQRTGKDVALVARDVVASGLAATLLRAAVPDAGMTR